MRNRRTARPASCRPEPPTSTAPATAPDKNVGPPPDLLGAYSNLTQEGAWVQFAGVSNIYTNGCAPNSLLDPPVGPTVDDLVTAWANIPQLAASMRIARITTPVDITVDGYTVLRRRGWGIPDAADHRHARPRRTPHREPAMNHRNHLIPCLIAAAVAIVLFTTIGTNPIGAGLGVAFLLCPIVMGTVMWLLMRQEKPTTIDRQRDMRPNRQRQPPGTERPEH